MFNPHAMQQPKTEPGTIQLSRRDIRGGGYYINAHLTDNSGRNTIGILTAWMDHHLGNFTVSWVANNTKMSDVKRAIDMILKEGEVNE